MGTDATIVALDRPLYAGRDRMARLGGPATIV